MIKLLTGKEHFIDTGKAIYKGNELVFEGTKTRGNYKQIYFELNEADYITLRQAIKVLGLEDYIQTESDGKLVAFRIIVEE